MKDLSTPSRRLAVMAAALATVTLAATLVGCDNKKPAAPPAVAKAASAPASAPPPPPPKPEPLKVAFAYVGPVAEGGWNATHDAARRALEQRFGDKIVTSAVANVPESPEAGSAFRDLAAQGNKLIFGTAYGHGNGLLAAAAANPTVKFEHATGYKGADNVRVYDARTYESAYMAGILAGEMTRNYRIGIVASVPVPEVIRNINAFTLGAQTVKRSVVVRVGWVGDWVNPAKEKEVANNLISTGVDVLIQATESTAVLQQAQARGKRAIGWDTDMSAAAPKAHLATAVLNWQPYYTDSVQAALDGSWKPGRVSLGVKEGVVDLVNIAPDVPKAAVARVDAVRQGLKAGTFTVFKGPLSDNKGKQVLATNGRFDDEALARMHFYVKGIEGDPPAAKDLPAPANKALPLGAATAVAAAALATDPAKEDKARAKAEADAKLKAEKEAKAKADAEARAQADAKAKADKEAAAKAKAEADAKLKAELNAKWKARLDARAAAEAKEKAEKEAVAKAKAEADAKAKAEKEAKAKADAEARAQADAKAKADKEAAAKVKAEADAKLKAEKEAKAKADAEARAQADARAKADREAAAKAKGQIDPVVKAQANAITQKAEADAAAIRAKAEAQAKADAAAIRAKAEADAAAIRSSARAPAPAAAPARPGRPSIPLDPLPPEPPKPVVQIPIIIPPSANLQIPLGSKGPASAPAP